MSTTVLEIINKALGKIGGAGDQVNGEAFLTNLNGTDKVTTWAVALYSQVRQKTIVDLASKRAPFRETLKYADLGDPIAAASLPEIGGWEYAFTVPSDNLYIIKQFEEEYVTCQHESPEYQFETILDAAGTGWLLLTNNLSNSDNDSAYIQYVIDQITPALFSIPMIEAIACQLAAELCPLIGKDMKTRAAVIAEYDRLVLKRAQIANQSQQNNYVHHVPDYSGGRSGLGHHILHR
jgi:hypothetical protein